MISVKSAIVLMLIFKAADEISCDCILSLNNDFTTAVYLRNGEYLAPNLKGAILLRRGAAITVACPGKGRHVVFASSTTDFESVEAKCVSNKTFAAGRWQGQFGNISCSGQPVFSAQETQETCHRGLKIVRVGYTVNNQFHSLYEACFNEGSLSTAYVKHKVTPMSYFSQQVRRPSFTAGAVFGKTPIANFYTADYQKKRINAILGADMDKKYVTKAERLTRGHLAPNADFSLASQKRASFHYVNVAPQWKRGNSGDWAALEDGLRRRVHKLNITVTVYTGAFGVLTLPDNKGVSKELYLSEDINGNYVVPVPLYFYKIVHDPQSRKATAFITINTSYYDDATTARLSFCADRIDELPWLSRRNDATHSFCCRYDEFAAAVEDAPRIDADDMFI